MTILNVRCCCQPKKILGCLPVSDPTDTYFDVPSVDGKVHKLEVRDLFHAGNMDDICHERAVYSDDRPVEFWRQIVGFQEGVEVPNELVCKV